MITLSLPYHDENCVDTTLTNGWAIPLSAPVLEYKDKVHTQQGQSYHLRANVRACPPRLAAQGHRTFPASRHSRRNPCCVSKSQEISKKGWLLGENRDRSQSHHKIPHLRLMSTRCAFALGIEVGDLKRRRKNLGVGSATVHGGGGACGSSLLDLSLAPFLSFRILHVSVNMQCQKSLAFGSRTMMCASAAGRVDAD